METLAATTGREKSLAKGFGVELGFGIVLARSVHSRIGQAEHDPPEHA
jgi:hypothetical protein